MSGRRPNLAILGLGLGLVLAFALLLRVNLGTNTHEAPFALRDRPAPAFALEDLDGNPVALADLRGRPVVINAWSTWCVSCRDEHALLLEAPRLYPDVVFLGLLYGDDPAKARVFLERTGTSFPHLVDPGGVLALDLGVAGVPETFFVDREGILRRKHIGPLDAGTLAALLEGL